MYQHHRSIFSKAPQYASAPIPLACNPGPSQEELPLPHIPVHVNMLLFEGGGGGGGFLVRDGGGGGGPLIFAPAELSCDVAGETDASPYDRSGLTLLKGESVWSSKTSYLGTAWSTVRNCDRCVLIVSESLGIRARRGMSGIGDTSLLIWVGPWKVVDLLNPGRLLEPDECPFAGDSEANREDTERVDLMLGLCSGSGEGGGDGPSAGTCFCAYGFCDPVFVLDLGCGRGFRV